ncbi:signal transduction histidine kinase [Burkholderiales bacterium JOSHI_001]|nr:signal transduction histidine kinase [Burkholderiales bacterium JOSHI_001]
MAPSGPASGAAPSLRRTLLAWLLLPLGVIVPAAVALQYALVLEPAREAFDQALGNTALSVAAFVHDEQGEPRFDMNPQVERSIRTDQQDSIYYVVLGPSGQRLAGDPPLAEAKQVLAADGLAYFDTEIDGASVRVAARGVACGDAVCQVRVGETQVKRQRVFRESLTGTVAGVLAFALASLLSIVLAARRGLLPLQQLSEQMGQRSLDDLRPLDSASTPRELHGLVAAMNRLLDRVRSGSLAQQAFLADAAHQLRTPLAALKNEAELALAEDHPPQVQATLARLNAGAARAARLSSQLLALARSDSAAAAALPSESLDWESIAAEAAQEWVPRALAAGIDLGFELQPTALAGRRFLLRELLANLLHNAIAYAGPGAVVTVRCRPEGQEAVLEVEDNGPGIAPDEREAVFRRFQRGRAATLQPGTASEGSGLGLAIVRDIATGHGGRVALQDADSGRGLRVRVTLPARAP